MPAKRKTSSGEGSKGKAAAPGSIPRVTAADLENYPPGVAMALARQHGLEIDPPPGVTLMPDAGR